VGATQYLPSQVFFGYGSILTTPSGTQTTIAQTTTVLFNSRGIAIDTTSFNPTSNDVIYLYDKSNHYYAVSVSAGGKQTMWVYITTATPPWQEI